MPTYEYECTKCGHEFEAVQSMKDPHLKDCPQPECEGPVKRRIGLGSGFIFKGTGFYITDYRSDSYKAAAKKDTESAGTASAGSSSSTASTAGGGQAAATPAPKPAAATA